MLPHGRTFVARHGMPGRLVRPDGSVPTAPSSSRGAISSCAPHVSAGRRAGLLALFVMLPMAGRAAQVEVPLMVDTRFLQAAVEEVLEFGVTGTGQMQVDDCNRVELSDLVVATGDGEVVVSLAVHAISGAWAFGRCLGPSSWQGRMKLDLLPGLESGGLVVTFTPLGVELVRADGSPGLLSGPTRMLAEGLVLPRIERVRLDLAESLAAIDALLESATPDRTTVLVERTRIHEVRALDAGLLLRIGFQVEATADVEGPPAEPPLAAEDQVRWQRLEDELDGFLTTVIFALAGPAASDELRLELLAVLLDARHAIAEALSEDGDAVEEGEGDHLPALAQPPDPVRRVFVESWDRLRPWLAELDLADVAGLEADLRLAAFMAGGDALRALDALGPEFGLDISSDGLRRLARLLLAEEVPERFTPLPLDVDPAFRALFGMDRPQPAETRGRRPGILTLLVPLASARAESPADALRGLVPRLAILDEYLRLVASLLDQQTGEHLSAGSRIPSRLKSRLDPLVWATAWKESCWRQFTGSTDNPRVLTSRVGALGMMQVNGRVWRGVYDLERLAEEVAYNVSAGTGILEHYLVDYAIRRGEHKHPGGDDNLIRATYAAYNGGPSHLGRYRRDDTPARLRAIDNEFWQHYQTIKSSQWPDVASCYAVGG